MSRIDFQTSLAQYGSTDLMATETKDCSVKAVAFVCKVSYDTAHAALRKQGRRNRKGAYTGQIINACASLGFKVEQINPYQVHRTGAKTVRTAEGKFAGNCLIFVRGHVLASVDGRIKDWTEGRMHRLLAVYRVTRTGEEAAPVEPTPVPTVKPQPQRKPRTGVTARVRSVMEAAWIAHGGPISAQGIKLAVENAKRLLVAEGINRNTINTQIHHWKKSKGL